MGGGSGWNRWREIDREEQKKKKPNDEKLPVDELPNEEKLPVDELPNEEKLARIYQAMRVATHELEELIENEKDFTDKELHRLDKSVVVQKAGYKFVKKILTKRGYSGLKRAAFKDMIRVKTLDNSQIH